MNFDILKDELALPTYAAMSDVEARDALNLADIVRIKATMTGAELLDEQDSVEFIALSDAKKAQWLSLTSNNLLDPKAGGAVQEIVKDIWGAASPTVANLAIARNETVSRAAELGLGEVSEGNVNYARTL